MDTYNQFDKKYKNLDGYECNACPMFAVITVKNFMDNGQISKSQHEQNLDCAVINRIMSKQPKYMSFKNVISLMKGYDDQHIEATTPELVSKNILGYNQIFDNDKNHGVIFLKNGYYIVVLAKKDSLWIYAVRDCHKKTQHTFNSLTDLQLYLNKTYQFDKLNVVSGVNIEGFTNIEYLTITKPFDTILDLDLVDDDSDDEMSDDIEFTKMVNETDDVNEEIQEEVIEIEEKQKDDKWDVDEENDPIYNVFKKGIGYEEMQEEVIEIEEKQKDDKRNVDEENDPIYNVFKKGVGYEEMLLHQLQMDSYGVFDKSIYKK
jgi:hypothetical protein